MVNNYFNIILFQVMLKFMHPTIFYRDFFYFFRIVDQKCVSFWLITRSAIHCAKFMWKRSTGVSFLILCKYFFIFTHKRKILLRVSCKFLSAFLIFFFCFSLTFTFQILIRIRYRDSAVFLINYSLQTFSAFHFSTILFFFYIFLQLVIFQISQSLGFTQTS